MNPASINLGVLAAASFLMPLTYIFSLQPVRFEAQMGKRAWLFSGVMRTLSNISEGVMAACMFVWIWFPADFLSTPIFADGSGALALALLIGIPFAILDIIAVWQLGMETHLPSKGTRLRATGMYRCIRHPQVLFEISLFPLGALALNAGELTVIFLLYFGLYASIVLRFEERDLRRKFGAEYVAYQRRTGAILPLAWKRS